MSLLTSSNMNIPASNGPHNIRRNTLVNRSMDILSVVLCAEWQEHQGAIGSHVPQPWNVLDCGSYSTDPGYVWAGPAVGRTRDLGTVGVVELDQVRRLDGEGWGCEVEGRCLFWNR